MRLFAARHGQTTWNVERRLMGQKPGELTAQGELEAVNLGQEIAELSVDSLFASDLNRVKQTVEIILQQVPGLAVNYSADLRERSFGDLEGELYKDVDMSVFDRLGFEGTESGIETERDVTKRVARFCVEVYERGYGKPVVFVCHTGIMNRLKYLEEPHNYRYEDFGHATLAQFDFDKVYDNALAFAAREQA